MGPPETRRPAGGNQRAHGRGDDATTILPGRVRAVDVIRPCRGCDLTSDDVYGARVRSRAVVVELGASGYGFAVADALAGLALTGHDVDVRGTRWHLDLMRDIEIALSMYPNGAP